MPSLVTLKICGLILLQFKAKEKICKAGILTTAPAIPEHKFLITIINPNQPEIPETIECPLSALGKYAPLHLYVTPPNGIPVLDSAIKGADGSYKNTVVDFEGNKLQNRLITLKPDVLAPLLIHQGNFYVNNLDLADADIETIGTGTKTYYGKPATMVSVDINLGLGEQLLLVGENGYKRSIALDVSNGGTYIVNIQNAPVAPSNPSLPTVNHFDKFYDAIVMGPNEPEYMISLRPPAAKDSPPCIATQIGTDSW